MVPTWSKFVITVIKSFLEEEGCKPVLIKEEAADKTAVIHLVRKTGNGILFFVNKGEADAGPYPVIRLATIMNIP